MGLPRSIPSGGAGLDTFSEGPTPQASRPDFERKPLGEANPRKPATPRPTQRSPAKTVKATPKKAAPEEALPAESDELSEFLEFQRWKKMKEAGGSQTAEPAKKSSVTSSKKKAQSKPVEPVQDEGFVDDAFETVGDESSLKTKVDPKTGIPYYEIPKTKMGSDGKPLLEIDIDIYDLNGEAEAFMAHLRVPPSKEEREALLAKRAEMAKQQRLEKEENDKELENKYGSLEQEVDPFNENAPKKRGIFKKKS